MLLLKILKGGFQMKKIILVLSILFILLLTFTTLAQVMPKKIKLLHIWGGTQKEHIDRLLKEYAKIKPDIEIVADAVAGAGAATYQEVLQTRFAAGEGPDIYFEWGGELSGFFVDRGFAEPLDKYYKKYNWYERFYPMAIEAVKRKGRIYGVPIRISGMTFWYNKNIWNKLNLKEPQSYDEFEALCDKTKKAGIYPLALGGKYGWNTMRLLDYLFEVTCGPKLFDNLRTLKLSWNRPEVVKAYTLFKKWVDNWVIPGFINLDPTSDARPIFYQGKTLMCFEGSWLEQRIIEAGFSQYDYDFFIPPTGHIPVRFSAFPEQFIISSKTKYKDEAAEFLNWLTQKETFERELGKALSPLPPVRGVKIDKNIFPNSVKWMNILTSFEKTYPPTDQVLPPELLHEFYTVQDGIVTGKFTPKEAAKYMDEIIKKWKQK